MAKKIIKGLTNKIEIENGVLKKTSNAIVDYFIDRNNEKNFYDQIVKMKLNFIIPPIEYKFENGVFISKYKYHNDIKTLNEIAEFDQNLYSNIKELISKFHSLNLDIKLFNPKEFLEKFTSKVEPILELEKFKNEIENIIKNYYLNTQPVTSHNDLVPGNILIINNEFKLIDFEFTYKNHYLFDYASFISETCNEKQSIEFINSCGFSIDELDKLNQLIKYQNYLWSYWAKYMYVNTNIEIYSFIMKEKIKRIEKKYN